MKEYNTIQELRAFEQAIYDAAAEGAAGVTINPDDLTAEAADAPHDGGEWIGKADVTTDGAPDIDKIADIAARYCFVR